MKKPLLLNLFKDLTSQGGQLSSRKTPGNVGKGLFAAFLKTSQKKLFQPQGFVPDSSRKREEIREKGILHLLEEISRLLGEVKVSPQMASRLMEVLGGQQVDKDSMAELITKASDKEGKVGLVRLLRQAVEAGLISKSQVPENTVPLPQVPILAKLLLDSGFRVEDVKGIIEASKAEGGAKTSQVYYHLEKIAPGLPIEKLMELLVREGIAPKKGGLRSIMSDPQIKELIETAVSRGEPGHAVKLKLATALREKGLGPSEVKKILERLTVEELKSRATNPKDPNKSEKKVLDDLRKEIAANNSYKADKGQQVGFRAAIHKVNAKLETLNDPKNGVKNKAFQGIKSQLPESTGLELEKVEEIKPKGQEIALSPLWTKAEAVSPPAIPSSLMQSNRAIELQETISKVTEFMKLMVRRGEQEAVIRLSPPDLGELDLQVVMRDGHLQARMSTEAAWVKEILENNIVQLRHQLEEMGFVVAKLEVKVGWTNREQRGGNGSMWSRSRKNGKGSHPSVSSPEPANLSGDALVHVVA